MDISDSITYDKEQMLEAMVAATGLSPEEFGVNHIIEEYPVEILKIDNILSQEYQFTVRQNFRVRLKTIDEQQLPLESKEKNDDSNES